jgi:hypothetical protein
VGVPLKIYGGLWEKAREWPVLRAAWLGPPIYGQDYVKAIQCAKVCLGLLSKDNRDSHTQRSAEIPFIGSVFCAERTPEHEAMYEDGMEAVYWSSVDECAEKIFYLLRNSKLRIQIAKAGRMRCIKNGLLNEVIVNNVLNILKG